ncbi:gag poly protein [Trichoderma arundinaceum]|uniref:Gag poly protein n=1 Tax=Trichoderma arundinaceum TaxID=490622 RepID=A0A395P1G3_TRIAR|nr:gag poly protein [Trichoderma arundinaceum]
MSVTHQTEDMHQDDAEMQEEDPRMTPTEVIAALDNLTGQLQQLQNQRAQDQVTIAQLQQQLRNAGVNIVNPAPAIVPQRREKQLGEIVKPAPPERFMGDPAKIQKFFIDMRTHFEYYYPVTFAPDKIEDRVKFAGTRLGGPAATWFDPILEDFRKNTPDKRDEQTQTIFLTYENFKKQLQKTFRSTNEEREAENQLRIIKQKGALAKHTVNFIQLLTKVK